MKRFIITAYYQLSVDRTSWPLPYVYNVLAKTEDEALFKVMKEIWTKEKEDDPDYPTDLETFRFLCTTFTSTDLLWGRSPKDFTDEEGYVLAIVETIYL